MFGPNGGPLVTPQRGLPMRALDIAKVANWHSAAGYNVPKSVDTRCPKCRRSVNFALGSYQTDDARKTVSASADCPACRGQVGFWILRPGPAHVLPAKVELIAMHPP